MVMIADQESEKARFERGISCYKQKARATTLPHRILLGRFAEKVATLRSEPDDDAVRTRSATLLSTLIESVTICPTNRVARRPRWS